MQLICSDFAARQSGSYVQGTPGICHASVQCPISPLSLWMLLAALQDEELLTENKILGSQTRDKIELSCGQSKAFEDDSTHR